MVHLNLAIALLCGLIVFVSGVETATENKVKLSYICENQKAYINAGLIIV